MNDIERMAKEVWEKVLAQEPHTSDTNQRSRLARFMVFIAEDCAKTAENTYEGYSESEGDTGFSINGDNSARAIRAKYPMPKEPSAQ